MVLLTVCMFLSFFQNTGNQLCSRFFSPNNKHTYDRKKDRSICISAFNPSWTIPACASVLLDHTHFTEHTKKMGSLTQCPISLYFSTDLFQNLCVCSLYRRLLYIVRKLCCYGNKLATVFERGTLTAST